MTPALYHVHLSTDALCRLTRRDGVPIRDMSQFGL